MDLSRIQIAEDGTHHILDGRPMYRQRYRWVLAFHPPGLAAAGDETGAFHIGLNGEPHYTQRFLKTFGFYEDRAAVQTRKGWNHITPSGSSVYHLSFAWVGNFQESRCTVRRQDGQYYHILPDGSPAYDARWSYAGDYRDHIACVQRKDGLYTHIDHKGKFLHGQTFLDLDVFHKQYARARDNRGWHHIDRLGCEAYTRRFASVEPFYNGQARVEDKDGALLMIDEQGQTLLQLRRPQRAFRIQRNLLGGNLV